MMYRQCPYCACQDGCGRETFHSRPYSSSAPSSTDVYDAVREYFERDRTILEVDERNTARGLVLLGYLKTQPLSGDTSNTLDLLAETETPKGSRYDN